MTRNNKAGTMPARKRPLKHKPSAPRKDVREIQDPEHTEADFKLDLDKVIEGGVPTKKPKPDRPDGASRKT